MDKIDDLLTRIVANIIPSRQKLEKVLRSGKKLNIYFGIDPTFTRIHLGNAVPLRKLQAFVEDGHKVTFLIGDFTALIGDTSDKDSERPVLIYRQIETNFQTYKKQAEKIVNFSKVKIRKNSEWLKKLNFVDVIKLTRHFSVNDFIGRELIKKRLEEGKSVSLPEVLYPVMQGYDSYFLDTDIQIGGTDQVFNMQAGRTLQKHLRGKESFVIETSFPLEGTDGRKMSKSWGNAIWLDDKPEEIFGKVMSLKDNLIMQYFTLATNTSQQHLDSIEKRLASGKTPITVKKELARQIVSELYGQKAAEEAGLEFENTFQKRGLPSSIRTLTVSASSINLLDLVFKTKATKSRSEAKRLIVDGAIDIDGRTETDPNKEMSVPDRGLVVKIGKTKFVRIKSK